MLLKKQYIPVLIMNLFYTECNNYDYTNNLEVTETSDLYCPLNIDTEFYNRELNDVDYAKQPSPTITIQVRGIEDNDKGKIYTHNDCIDIARHSVMEENFIGIQYLKDNGYEVTLTRPCINNPQLLKTLPKIHFHLYAHFIVADLARVFYGDYRQDILDLIIYAKNGSGKGITQERRTRSYSQSGHNYYEYCPMNWLLKFNGITYQVTIGLRDTSGIAGAVSYNDLGILSGIELKYKNSLKTVEKQNMIDTYLNNTDFDNYALGDLYCTDMIKGLNNLFQLVQTNASISELNQIPIRLTIGSSIARMVENILTSKLINKKLFKQLTINANSDYLRKCKDTRALLSKVDGGRCFNNRPLDIVINKQNNNLSEDFFTELNSLCDIDINSAYGRGLSLQDYPLGTPKCFNHLLDKENKYITLREFLNKHGDELIDGLWTMRVSTKNNLKYPQDFISSWIVDIDKIDRLSSDDEDDISVDYPKIGYSKIFSNQIILGTITSDILDLILNVCSQRQSKELLDNLLVNNAIWYDAKQEVKKISELEYSVENYDELDESFYEDDLLVNIRKDNYKWYRFNLGDLMINNLLKERSKYPKKSPENEFYKLCINTTYGVLVSKYFTISNTIVGNNITARCRVMAWCMEKGLNGIQTITDGCVFELDKVVHPTIGKRLTANNLVRGYSKNVSDRKWYLDKLKINKYFRTINKDGYIIWDKCEDGRKVIISRSEEIIKKYPLDKQDLMRDLYKRIENGENIDLMNIPLFDELNASQMIEGHIQTNKEVELFYNIELDILRHLKNVFPNLKVLHKVIKNNEGYEQIGYYSLEIKCFSNKGTFHANADYKLSDNSKMFYKDDKLIFESVKDSYKMRGYKNKDCYLIDENSIEDNEIEIDDLFLDNMTTFNESFSTTNINVPEYFLNKLENNSDCIERNKPFIQNNIIKCKDYKQKYRSSYKDNNMSIGYTEKRTRLLTELVLSQFLFIDNEQYQKWLDNHNKAKQKYGQGYESLFCDGLNLHYKTMIHEIDRYIINRKTMRLKPLKHPYFELKLLEQKTIKNTSIELLE